MSPMGEETRAVRRVGNKNLIVNKEEEKKLTENKLE